MDLSDKEATGAEWAAAQSAYWGTSGIEGGRRGEGDSSLDCPKA